MMATVKPTDLAWAAGFIDGEGCFYAYHANHGTRHQWTIRVLAANNDLRSLRKLQHMFGGSIQVRPPERGRNAAGQWSTSFKLAVRVAKCLLPYLIVKKEQAIVLIKLGELICTRKGRYSLSTKDHKLRLKLNMQLKGLKHGNSRAIN